MSPVEKELITFWRVEQVIAYSTTIRSRSQFEGIKGVRRICEKERQTMQLPNEKE
jgi:hypothetical protein